MYVEVTAYFQVAGERVAESDPQRVSIGAALHPAKMNRKDKAACSKAVSDAVYAAGLSVRSLRDLMRTASKISG